jgi:hypothetical protein
MEGVTPVARLSVLIISIFIVLLPVTAVTGASVPRLCAVINYHTGTTIPFLFQFLFLRPHLFGPVRDTVRGLGTIYLQFIPYFLS